MRWNLLLLQLLLYKGATCIEQFGFIIYCPMLVVRCLPIALVASFVALQSSASECDAEEDEVTEEWMSKGGFMIFFLFVAMSFWGLAVVCEDFFVPSLNLLCDDLKLDNDVAGATIMAAGNSSPELFACFISLFATKTALGAGTAVGSAIFNHLCICSGSVIYARGGELQLDWRILARECVFYGSSLLILVWALKGTLVGAFEHAFDHVGGHSLDECLSVHWYQAFVLVLGYVLYAVVCSNYRVIIALLCPLHKASPDDSSNNDNAHHIADTTIERIGIDENGEAKPLETYEAPIPLRPGLSLAYQKSFSEMQEYLGEKRESVLQAQATQAMSQSQHGKGGTGEFSRTSSWNSAAGGVHNPLCEDGAEEDVEMGQSRRNHVVNTSKEPTRDDEEVSRRSESSSPTTAAEEPEASQAPVPPPVVEDTTIPAALTEEERRSLQHEQAMMHAERASRLTGNAMDESRVSFSPMEVPKNATYQCWMYKRSQFYSRIRVLTSQKWQLRYFRVDRNGLWYCRHNMQENGKLQVKTINIFDAISVYATDLDLFEFVIVTPKRKYVFRCTNEDNFMGMFSVLAKDTKVFRSLPEAQRRQLARDGEIAMKKLGIDVDHENGAGHDLMTPPSGGLALALHYLLLPLKAMIYYTIPEISVEQDGDYGEDANSDKEAKPEYQTTIWMCVLWLAVLSYVMNYCLEELGAFFGISSGTMGLTFGAAGTSFPNLLSSMIVAKQGLGNMAVSNAFGSNVFCIFFGLGLPWLLYILSNNGDAYKGLKDDGIVFAVIILLIVLLSFLVLLAVYNFKMKQWMGTCFLVLYGVYLLYAIAIG